MHRYLHVRQTILEQILDGTLSEGGFLPSEYQLAKDFDVSRPTIRQALRLLEEERVLTSRQGLGRMICKRPQRISSNLSQLESIEAMISSTGQKLHDLKRVLEEGVLRRQEAMLLRCVNGTSMKRLIRVRAITDVPVAVTVNLFPKDMAPSDLEIFSGSLLNHLKTFGQSIDYAESEILVPTIDDRYASMLKVSKDFVPILVLQQLHYNWVHKPVFLSYDYLNTNVFSVRVRRKSN